MTERSSIERLSPLARRLVGIVPSENTPFSADGEVDLAAVRRLARASLDAGVAGLLILAVASENRSLSIKEREAVGAVFVEEIGGRIPVIAAVSAPTIDEALALTRIAVGTGADAVCYQAPAGIAAHDLDEEVARICDCGPQLFMLQDLDWTGPGLSLETIARLFERHPTFRAIKVEANPAGPKYTALLEAFEGRLHVSGGWAIGQMIEALERGVHAFMPTAMDHLYVEIHARFAAGDIAGARALFERMLPFLVFSNQHIEVSIRFFKRLRLLDGTFATDRCRAPTPELDRYQQATLEHLAARAVALDREIADARDRPTNTPRAPRAA